MNAKGLPETADLEIASGIARAERAAFDAFFERFFAPVWRFARARAGADAEALALRIFSGVLEELAGGACEAPLALRVYAHACRAHGEARRDVRPDLLAVGA
jgi:DNA-directed RNA polymerase specialized sigma24 family protein